MGKQKSLPVMGLLRMKASKLIHVFAHRGCGVTDIGPQDELDAKGEGLKSLPPENSEEAVETAFKNGFFVEVDVVMTADGHLVVTHINDLSFHNAEAKKARETGEEGFDWYVCRKTLAEIERLETGLGGRTASFLTYEKFLGLMRKYPDAVANVEIKGTIQKELMAEPKEPSLIEVLVEKTPNDLLFRIVWSSFANSNIVRMRAGLQKKLGKLRVKKPEIQVAQLFAEPTRNGGREDKIYPDTDDLYMQFTEKNVAKVFRQGILAVHPCIESLMTAEGRKAVQYCAAHNITIRTWALNEKNPLKGSAASVAAKERILFLKELNADFPSLKIDVITDYPAEVQSILLGEEPRTEPKGPIAHKNALLRL